MFDLSGQVALVTGAGRGLGREMAAALAEQGADLILCSRSPEELRAVAAEITAGSARQVLIRAADVTQPDQVKALVDAAREQFGRIDILVNNAGAGYRRPLLDLELEDWRRILDVCLTAPYVVARAVAPMMIAAGYGRILNISSALGSIALPERGPYCAAKGGLIQLTKVMALEWSRHGITVNALCPGPFRTPYNLRLEENPALYESYLGLIPQHRWAELHEIRGAAVFLASREAAFVNGSALYVDGGWTAHGGIPMDGATDPHPSSSLGD